MVAEALAELTLVGWRKRSPAWRTGRPGASCTNLGVVWRCLPTHRRSGRYMAGNGTSDTSKKAHRRRVRPVFSPLIRPSEPRFVWKPCVDCRRSSIPGGLRLRFWDAPVTARVASTNRLEQPSRFLLAHQVPVSPGSRPADRLASDSQSSTDHTLPGSINPRVHSTTPPSRSRTHPPRLRRSTRGARPARLVGPAPVAVPPRRPSRS